MGTGCAPILVIGLMPRASGNAARPQKILRCGISGLAESGGIMVSRRKNIA
jgi:hypothetical protein